ncbi:MAG: TMEM175 family protein [Thermomicrobiales bacterium]
MALIAGRWGQNETALERLIFFSDAVFAIAITLLALEIRLPDTAAADATALAHQVLDLAPNMIAFVITFLVIGSYWLAHYRIFHYITRYDSRLLWLNLFFLLCIAFMPFPSGLLARHGDTRFAVTFYAVFLAITGLILSVIWLYATWRSRLVPPGLSATIVRDNALRLLAAAGIFLGSLVLVFWRPYAVEGSWLLLILVRPIVERFDD